MIANLKHINRHSLKRKIFSFLFVLSIPAVFSSCINLRQDYPEIKYYNLESDSAGPSRTRAIGTLQVRPAGGANEISQRRFLVDKSDGSAEKYYYHRWSDDFQELFTWQVISELSRRKYFTGGIVNQGTALIPDYILESDILKLKVYNDLKNIENESYVELSIKVNLLGFSADSNKLYLIYTNVYEKKVNRVSNKAVTIAPAVSRAANEIISQFSEDIVNAINK